MNEVPEFTKWFNAEMERTGWPLREAADRIKKMIGDGDRTNGSTVDQWKAGTRPGWRKTVGIARAFGADVAEVLALAHYADADIPAQAFTVPVSIEQQTLLDAYEAADAAGRAALLAVARSIFASAAAKDEPDPEGHGPPRNRPGPA